MVSREFSELSLEALSPLSELLQRHLACLEGSMEGAQVLDELRLTSGGGLSGLGVRCPPRGLSVGLGLGLLQPLSLPLTLAGRAGHQ
jgi:hypothetical protein